MSRKFFGRTTGNASFNSGFRVGSNKLFVDSSLDRVGIGTTDPTSTLDVRGDLHVDDKVGIGTSSPSEELHVYSDNAPVVLIDAAAGNDSRLRLRSPNDRIGYIEFSDPEDADTGEIRYEHSTNNMVFSTNGTSEAMRIDNSGNLLVGKTGSAFGTEGVEVRPDALWVTRDGDTPVFLNRETTEGNILTFSKDGTYRGAIGIANTDNLFISGDASHSGISFATNSVVPFANGALSDGTEDIGHASYRWKDGHFSGTVTADAFVTSGSGGGDYREGEVIEELHGVANGGTLPGNSATLQTVTGRQSFGTTYEDFNGSVVSNYAVPTGTKTVVYEFMPYIGHQDYRYIAHFKLYYKVGSGSWVEVSDARHGFRDDQYTEHLMLFRWPFTVNASTADTSAGVLTEATPTLSFKWMAREYSTSYEFSAHHTDQWDGGGTDQTVIPRVMVKAIAGS